MSTNILSNKIKDLTLQFMGKEMKFHYKKKEDRFSLSP